MKLQLYSLLLAVALAAAQSNTGTQTTTLRSLTSRSSTNTITSSSATATSKGASTRSTPSIQLPPLVQCSFATFSFTIPSNLIGLPKHLGFYPSSASSWIETVHLGTQYDDLTEGSFTWLVDLPVGLSIAAMFYVTEPENNGAIPPNGSASTSDSVILAGTRSDCLAGNAGELTFLQFDNVASLFIDPFKGASTSSIVAIASSYDPTFIWTGTQPTSSSGGRDGGNQSSPVPAGAIVGAVIGGITLVTAVALFLFYLKRRHNQKMAARDFDGYSTYSEKPHMWTTTAGMGSVHGFPVSEPPPGTYWSQDETGKPILIAAPGSGLAKPQTSDHGTMVNDMSMSEVDCVSPMQAGPKRIAPIGSLPEPMGDEDDDIMSSHDNSRSEFRGAEGLDDPNSFLPK
ncbi:hypothetical protein OIV83_002339 [Microbotryomycetes sp. JL201]|nr:hypothetical protein OIV83_002339 [Microbotryomycetes sp. JL201]